jgi:hypothetical protein
MKLADHQSCIETRVRREESLAVVALAGQTDRRPAAVA